MGSLGGLSVRRGRERKREMVQGSGSIIGSNKIDGDVKNSIGKGEAKELTQPMDMN